MMQQYDEILRELSQKLAQRESYNLKLNMAKKHRDELVKKADLCKRELQAENADVENLEHISLASLFATLTGKKQEKLDVERAQAFAAKVRYDSAIASLNSAEEDVRRYQTELGRMASLQREYDSCIEKKAEEMRKNGTQESAELAELEIKIIDCNHQKKELAEAITAGRTALSSVQEIIKSLNSADGYATWDLLGGGLIADAMKYSNLDTAQERIHILQNQLRRFQTELADVRIDANVNVKIEGALFAGDVFFDNIFLDWAVKDKIDGSIREMSKVELKICNVQTTLKNLEIENEIALQRAVAKRKELIQNG